jgi:hypothetical protein
MVSCFACLTRARPLRRVSRPKARWIGSDTSFVGESFLHIEARARRAGKRPANAAVAVTRTELRTEVSSALTSGFDSFVSKDATRVVDTELPVD